MKRRTFLKAVGVTVGGASLTDRSSAFAQRRAAQTVQRQALGRTGEQVSIIGYPGFALRSGDQQAGTESLHRCF
ncbi:MAG: hypothetical protein AAF961_16640, partial [Planctomycetota bacterium]